MKSNFIADKSGRCWWHTVMKVKYIQRQDQRDEREFSDSRTTKVIKKFSSEFQKLRKCIGANKIVV